MATFGSIPSFNTWSYYGYNVQNQACTGLLTMPEDGIVTGIVLYAAAQSGSTTFHGVVWNSGGGVICSGAAVTTGAGSDCAGCQAWHTSGLSSGVYLAAGTQIRIGWTRPASESMLFSHSTGGSGYIAQGGDVGSLGSLTSVGAIGAYINYTPVSPPSATTQAVSGVTTTSATLHGSVGDGGLYVAGTLATNCDFNLNSSPTNYGQTSEVSTPSSFAGSATPYVNLTGLTPARTYYFQVAAYNEVGITYGSWLSFTTNGKPNPPTLLTPGDNSALNLAQNGGTFTWTYNTGGASGGQTAYAFQLVDAANGNTYYWNASTSSFQTAGLWNASSSTSVTIPAGKFVPATTYTWTVATQDAGGQGPYASPFTVISEGPPGAPSLTAPANAAYLEMASATPTFAWTYRPGNAVGGQTNWALRQKISGASGYQYWNQGTLAWQSTIVWNSGSVQSYTLPSGSFSDGNSYNWSVATQDAGGQGPFASDWIFTAQAIPVVTVSAPSGSVPTPRPNVVWSATFGAGAAQTNYQVRTFTAAQYGAGGFNPATSAASDDSGLVSGTVTSYQVQTPLPPGTSYRSYVEVTETGGEDSGYLAYGAFSVALDTPPAPFLTTTATTDPVTGCPMIQLVASALLNMLTAVDASFETGTGSFYGSNNCTVAQSPAQALNGSFSMVLTNTLAGAMTANAGDYAVTPGATYTVLASFRAAATSRSVHASVSFHDSAHAPISGLDGTPVADSTTGWTQSTVTMTAPANAAYAQVQCAVLSAALNEVHYVDEVGLFPGGSGTPWSAGGFFPSAGIVILRSDGLYVRGASPSPVYDSSGVLIGYNTAPLTPTGQTATVNDYEAVPLQPYTYQALIQASGQGLVQSAWSPAAGAALSTTAWWELDPTAPATAVAAQPVQWNPSITEQSASHQVLGQRTMLVIASAMMLTDMSASFETFDAPTYNGLLALATGQKTVFISDPFGHGYYFRLAPQAGGMSSGMGNRAHDSQLLPSTAGGPHRTVALTGISQPRPAV